MVARITRTTDRGQGSVIGVVLMLGIVVVLVATVGVYTLGFGDQTLETSPQVAMTTDFEDEMDADGQSLTVEFMSGQTLEASNVHFQFEGATTKSGASVEITGDQVGGQAGPMVRAGDTVELGKAEVVEESTGASLGGTDQLDLSDATLLLVWNPPDTDVEHSEVIWQWSA